MNKRLTTTRFGRPLKTKPRRRAVGMAAALLAVSAAATFMAALPKPALADDGCVWQTTVTGPTCVVTVTADDDPVEIYNGNPTGDGEDDEYGDNNGGDDGGSGPGDTEPPQESSIPPTTTTTIPPTTTTTIVTPAERARRQKELLKIRLGLRNCFDLMYPGRPDNTAGANLAGAVLFYAPGTPDKYIQWIRQSDGSLGPELISSVIEIATGPGSQTTGTITVGPLFTTVVVPPSFWGQPGSLGLTAEEYRTFSLLNAIAPQPISQAALLLNCFGRTPEGDGE